MKTLRHFALGAALALGALFAIPTFSPRTWFNTNEVSVEPA